MFDVAFSFLLETPFSRPLRRLVLFENFNQQYPLSCTDCEPIRTSSPDLSLAVAKESLKLQHLSASYMVDASDFFDSRRPSWEWPNLTSLALTSGRLVPDASPVDIDDMLRGAAAAAMRMPKLETMELWNGREGLAMLIRYKRAEEQRPAVITLRGTWDIALRPAAIEAWEAVAQRHRGHGVVVVKEPLGVGGVVGSHGDAIHHLELSASVVRPISLGQIRMEHEIRWMHR